VSGLPSPCCGYALHGQWVMSRRVICRDCLRVYLADVDPVTREHIWRTDDGPGPVSNA
jgi:hypothetical protein